MKICPFDERWWIVKNNLQLQKIDIESVCNKHDLENKTESYEGEVNTKFDNDGMLKEGLPILFACHYINWFYY